MLNIVCKTIGRGCVLLKTWGWRRSRVFSSLTRLVTVWLCLIQNKHRVTIKRGVLRFQSNCAGCTGFWARVYMLHSDTVTGFKYRMDFGFYHANPFLLLPYTYFCNGTVDSLCWISVFSLLKFVPWPLFIFHLLRQLS